MKKTPGCQGCIARTESCYGGLSKFIKGPCKGSLPERLFDVDTKWNIVSNKNGGFSRYTHSGVLGNLCHPRS
jgi:hypothetical protein